LYPTGGAQLTALMDSALGGGGGEAVGERYTSVSEVLAAGGAPVGCFWTARLRADPDLADLGSSASSKEYREAQ
jgi:hypothetical protein